MQSTRKSNTETLCKHDDMQGIKPMAVMYCTGIVQVLYRKHQTPHPEVLVLILASPPSADHNGDEYGTITEVLLMEVLLMEVNSPYLRLLLIPKRHSCCSLLRI